MSTKAAEITLTTLSEAVLSDDLDAFSEPFATALLERESEVEQLMRQVKLSGMSALQEALDDLIDKACMQGDAKQRSLPGLQDTKTLAVAAYIAPDKLHVLASMRSSLSLRRSIADALGRDRVQVSPLLVPSEVALAAGPSALARVCAVERMRASDSLPPGTVGWLPANVFSAEAALAMWQVYLLVTVRASSLSDAQVMGVELSEWIKATMSQHQLVFDFAGGQVAEVPCILMDAGSPWRLVQSSAFEVRAMIVAGLLQGWLSSKQITDAHYHLSHAVADPSKVVLMAWSPSQGCAYGSEFAAGRFAPMLLAAARRYLHAMCLVDATADGRLAVELIQEQGGSFVAISDGGALKCIPLEWDARLPASAPAVAKP